MNACFENPPLWSATGVTTAAILIVMLAMAASTVFTPEAAAPTSAAAASVTHVARAYHAESAKKI